MSNVTCQEAYARYLKVAHDPVVCTSEFERFWNALSPSQQEWWLDDFDSGQTKLDAKLLDFNTAFDAVQRGFVDHEMLAAIEVVLGLE